MSVVFALVAGLLFGAGLLLAGMTDPVNVLGFLDVTADWHPGLAWTMGGAIAIALPAFSWVRRSGRSLRGRALRSVDRFRIDAPLLLGSSVFGIGWGLTGICPGPGLMLLASGVPGAAIFAVSMIVGVYAADAFTASRSSGTEPVDELAASARFAAPRSVDEPRSVGFG